MRLLPAVLVALGLAGGAATPAAASPCQAFVESVPGVRIARLDAIPLSDATPLPVDGAAAKPISITYISHSSFRIETAGGVVAITDFFGAMGTGKVPDVVTMNHAHVTHWTPVPDPRIAHVLRGWKEGGGQAVHQLTVGDLTVRNVTTDIRGWGAPEVDGNSIFVFEVANLCLAHLGHLHHVLDEIDYAQLGTIDVVMAPVDGVYTLSTEELATVLRRLKARVVIPMHWFGPGSLSVFAEEMKAHYELRWTDGASIVVARDRMPETPQVVILQPLREESFD